MLTANCRTQSLLLVTTLLAVICVVVILFKGIPFRKSVPGSARRIDPVTETPPAPLPTLTGSRFQTHPSSLDPATDGWESEVAADDASSILNKMSKLVLGGNQAAPAHNEFFAAQFSLTTNTAELPVVHEDATLVVRRRDFRAEPLRSQLNRLDGAPGVAEFLASLLPDNADRPEKKLTMKIIGIDLRADALETTVRAEGSSVGAIEASQLVSLWKCMWSLPGSGTLQLVSAELQVAERVDRLGKTWFVDKTPAVIGRTSGFQSQLSYGLQHWLARIETAHGMSYFSKHGLAVGDANGDGRDDLYVCQPGGLPNRLFLHKSDGTATDHSQAFGVDLLDRTASALFVDLDNDGDQDLAVATLMGVQLLENVNQTRFQLRGGLPLPDIDLQGLSAVDYDNDGDLDLYQLVDYASNVTRAREGLPSFVYHNANDGGANRLFQNNIRPGATEWEFRDVTAEAGLDVNNRRHSLAAAWGDVDDDGQQDLYVANDYGPNCLYHNRGGGQFEEIADAAGVTDFGSGMSVSWADYDRDGRVDLYVGNMFSAAGSRVTTQGLFLPRVAEPNRALYRRFASGNSLFRNLGNHTFQEIASANVKMGRWSWSSLFADINNDGWEDLLVANGYITTDDTGDL